uniref:Uncharacterized protein n=1 Tax=Anguilla anguilla TaxID=7936 RepID=A0A0E9XMW6_ANGAN
MYTWNLENFPNLTTDLT